MEALTTDTETPRPVSRKMLWAGYIASALPVLLLASSAVMKIIKPTGMEEGMQHMGWPMELATPLAIVEIMCTVIYLIPRTAVLGAILLAAYLGGAVATHVRVGDPFIIPVAAGVLVWLGLYLRDPRVRALIPLRR
jgi:hypothetical protein